MGWLIAGALALTIAAIRTGKSWPALLLLLVISVGAFSRYIVELEPDDRTWVVDMSSGGFALSSVSIATFVILLLTPRYPGEVSHFLRFAVPLVLFLVVAYLFAWERTPDVRGGIAATIAATAAWFVGARIGVRLRAAELLQRLLAVGLLMIMTAQLAFALWQFATDSGFLDGRADGTFSHPAWLGKYVLILLVLLLPLASASSSRVRRPAVWAVVVGLCATGLTVSRANLIAIGAVLICWSIVRYIPERATKRPFQRVWLPLAVVILAMPFVSLILERFMADPEGGDRTALGKAGERVIQAFPWFGVAPNNFVNVASRTEQIIQYTGFPVHNTFLYGIAAFGFVGFVIFMFPVLATVRRALLASRQNGDISSTDSEVITFARAYLVCLLGVAFVAMSGWGFWQDPMLALLFLCSGVVYAMTQRERALKVSVVEADKRRSTNATRRG